MTRSLSRIVREERSRAALTVSTMILLSAAAVAQKPLGHSSSTSTSPAQGGVFVVDTHPKNKLIFPYGIQSFERKENVKLGNEVSVLPGWQFASTPSMVGAIVTEHPNGISRPGTESKRWLAIEDLGAGVSEGFSSPPIVAPSPWDYSWKFTFNVESAPVSGFDAPAFAIQHLVGADYEDVWGIRLTSTGAELFVNSTWGTTLVTPLFQYSGATGIGEWIDVRVVASLQKNTLTAFVNGDQVTMIRTRVPATTDVTRHRFSYHGGGAGNAASMLLDDVGVAFLGGGVCDETVTYGFDTEDDAFTVLGNGQDLTTAPEFGRKFDISAAGANLGATTFDSTPGGPNSGTADADMLIGRGNVLMLQSNTEPTQTVSGFFDTPIDDVDGGDFIFDFQRPCEVLSVDLIDIDPFPGLGASVTLTDFSSLTRVYTVPAGWTGTFGGLPGWKALDTTLTVGQTGNAPGFKTATVSEDPGFDPNASMRMVVHMTGRGAMDTLSVRIPCVVLTFENEDDNTPVFAGTTVVNGQDLSTPPEFGVEADISDAGPNAGAAAFDSTPGGPNDGAGKPDKDLLVGLGNILCLQNNLASAQSVSGIFNVPNDDTEGGTVFFDFGTNHGQVRVDDITLIDVDEEESVGVTVTLTDSAALTRTYTVPPGWTEDLLNDGPPGFRVLDLTTLAPQPGFLAIATGVEDPGFNPNSVVSLTVDLGGAQDMDNICFCPQNY